MANRPALGTRQANPDWGIILLISRRALTLFIAGLAYSWPLHAQTDLLDRPSDRRPELPGFQSESRDKILPSVRLPETSDIEGITAGRTVFIRDYRFSGNHTFSTSKLEAIAKNFKNRQISFSDLEKLRTEITQAYIKAGMVNSGALIQSQVVRDGIIEVQIVEGQLSEVTAQTSGRLRLGAVKKRLRRSGSPLNVFKLEEELQLIQQDPRVQRVHAQLLPGETPGEARLNLSVEEARPWAVGLSFTNDQPEAVGEDAVTLNLQHFNLLGFSDEFALSVTKTEGLEKRQVSYKIPVNSYGTTAGVRWSESSSEVVVSPFDKLEIEGKSSTLGAEIEHPLWRHPDSTLQLFLRAEARRSYTSLLGFGFSFTPGPEEGLALARVVRFGQDYTKRSKNQVFALRTTLSAGIDVDNATIREDDVPDAEFYSALVQFQLARKLELLDSKFIGRVDVQWSDSALLGMEQFAMGGQRTVRGYVQNSLVTDNGIVASLEWRVPLWRSGEGSTSLELAPFVDYGKGWNADQPDPEDDTLASAGLGLLFASGKRYRAEIWYGEALENIQEAVGSSLQEEGWHFSLSVTLP